MSYRIFSQVTFDKARQIVVGAKTDDYSENRQMYDGDHWGRSGKFWVGPHADTHPDMTSQIRSEIERLFVSRNVIKEVVDRHISAIDPHWKFTVRRPLDTGEEPTDDEKQRIGEATTLIKAWLEKRLTPMDDEDDDEDPVSRALANALMAGRSTVRLFVPRETLAETEEGDSVVPRGTLEESLDRIYLHTPDVTTARIYVYTNSMQRMGIYVETSVNEEQLISTTGVDNRYAELVYLDDQKRTVIRVTGEDEDSETTLDLRGRLTMHQLRRPVLVSPQVRSLQKSLNMCLTMMSRNVVLGGFLERVLLNGQLPGTWEQDAATGRKRFVPAPTQVGAGSINQFAGIEYERERRADGSVVKEVTQPQMVFREPVDVSTFKDSKELLYASMLEEAHQLHYLLADQGAASGESRKEAIADFVMDVAKTVVALNRLYVWLIETVLAMAANFANEPDAFADLRVVANCNIDTGRMTPDELRVISELMDRRQISSETGWTWMGLSDPEAERERLNTEREARAEEEGETAPNEDAINRLLNSAADRTNGRPPQRSVERRNGRQQPI